MTLLDYGNKYNENGKNLQVEYAKKMLNKSPSCIGVKNSKGAVLASLKPVQSKLHKQQTEEGIFKISENCYITATGIEPDKIFIIEEMKRIASEYKKTFNSEISSEYLRNQLNEYILHFNSNMGLRVLGCEFLVAMRESEKYTLFLAENNGSILRQTGAVIGSMHRSAKTELEKYNFEELSLEQLVDAAVRTFYVSFDALVDKEFVLDVGIIGNETNGHFNRLSEDELHKYAEKYKELSFENS